MMQRMLNVEDSKLKCITKNLDNFCSQRFMSCDLSLRNFNSKGSLQKKKQDIS